MPCLSYYIVLYVIDNASTDDTKKILDLEIDPRLVVINNYDNLGVAKANNQGILKAIEDGCDQVLIINNDVEFEPALIDKLIQVQKEKNILQMVKKMVS